MAICRSMIIEMCALSIATGLMLMADKLFEPQMRTNKRLSNNSEYLGQSWDELACLLIVGYPTVMASIPSNHSTDNYVDSNLRWSLRDLDPLYKKFAIPRNVWTVTVKDPSGNVVPAVENNECNCLLYASQ